MIWGEPVGASIPKIERRLTLEPVKIDPVDKIIANYPDNFVKKIAVGLDLSEYEQLRIQLEDNHAEQLLLLKQNLSQPESR